MHTMKAYSLKSDILLLITAAIWGTAFVAQRVGMNAIGPFAFNGARFAMGSLALVPLLLISRGQRGAVQDLLPSPVPNLMLWGGLLCGTILFVGASLQQVGLVYTTAGKAGFITGLYVIIVPLLGLFWKQRPGAGTWLGALLATGGLYLLSVTSSFTIAYGDLLQLLSAFCWAAHVLVIAWLSLRVNPIRLAFVQFVTCSLLSFLTAIGVEALAWKMFQQAAIPILYTGVISVGIAYTLQVVAQREAHPAHAAILMSLEAVFAALFGWLLLDETFSSRGLVGCALMLGGMLLSQLWDQLGRAGAKGGGR